MKPLLLCAAACAVACWAPLSAPQADAGQPQEANPPMRLGNFSISLAVKDLPASRAFYEKLGFKRLAGDGKRMLILQNDTCTIGLFQGMFDKNILTFNPGWDRTCATLPEFDDVRDLQRRLKEAGVEFATQADPASTGPASFVVFDPDGNQILVDQHVPKPGK